MKIIRATDYRDMSCRAAEILAAEVERKPDGVLGLATGSTPLGTYEQLVAAHKNGLDFSRCRTANLDEYEGLDADHPQSYAYFMRTNLLDAVGIPPESRHIPNGSADVAAAECERYEQVIKSLGGIDIQLLGIGLNGHIGFNEPSDTFSAVTHRVRLTDSTLAANARFFGDGEIQPKYAYTMGIGTIMAARKVVLIAGSDKTEIMEKVLYGPVTPLLPASILQFHHDITVIYCG